MKHKAYFITTDGKTLCEYCQKEAIYGEECQETETTRLLHKLLAEAALKAIREDKND